MKKFALIGATGSVGKSLAPVLAHAEVPFRVVGRSEEKLRKDFQQYSPFVEYQAADLNRPDEAAKAVEGIHTLFYLVGVPYTDFAQHPPLTKTTLQAAVDAGVQRFVHLSTVYPYGRPESEEVNEDHPRNPHTFKGQMRKQQEDLVIAADGQNGMRAVILRPPDFYGPNAELSYVHEVFVKALYGGVANVIGPVNAPHEFIFVPDLAETLWALSNHEEAYGHAWNIGGAGMITTRQFAELVFIEVGRMPRLRPAGNLLLRLMGLFNPFMKEVFEMHYLWTTPVILNDQRIRQLLPDLKKTSYEDGIRMTLDAMRKDPKKK